MDTCLLFVSGSGEILQRWLDAFPNAQAARPDAVKASATRPDLLWLRLSADADVPGRFGEIRRLWGESPVIVLADVPSDDQAIACFSQGARGYCNCHAQPALLRNVADVVNQGGLWVGESLLARLLRATSHALPASQPDATWTQSLTERECQVASAVADGAANKEIARQLGITERTVKAHTGAIFQKLGVRDRLQLSLLIHRNTKN